MKQNKLFASVIAYIFFNLVILLLSFLLLPSNKSYAIGTGTSSWKCNWVTAGHIYCETQNKISAVGGAAGVAGEQFVKEWKDYFYDPGRSIEAKHAVFATTDGNDPLLHISDDGTSASRSKNVNGSSPEVEGIDLLHGENASKTEEKRCALNSEKKDGDKIDCEVANGNKYNGPQWDGAQTLLDKVEAQQNCEKSSGTLGFIACPVLRMINESVGKTIGACDQCVEGQGILVELLTISPLQDDADKNLKNAWEGFKNIALSLYVLVFIVAIFANSLSLGIDQYTIKRMMPRLVAGAILTQFSWFIVWAMISITNLIGNAIPQLIQTLAPNGSFGYTSGLSNAFSATILGAGGVLFSGLGIILLIIIALWVLISLFIAILTLIARRLIIYILLLAAPIAFVAWILPNTEKLFKMWWSQLLKVMAMFPIATGLISISLLLSQIFSAKGGGTFNALVAAFFPIVALIMLPKTFKWGGSMLAAVSGAISSKVKTGQKAATGAAKKGAKAGGKRVMASEGANQFASSLAASKFGRAVGGRTAQAKTQAARAEYIKKANSLVENMGKDDLFSVATSGNQYERAAAIGSLAKKGSRKELIKLSQMGGQTAVAYNDASSRYFGDFEKNADLRRVGGKYTDMAKQSPESIAKLGDEAYRSVVTGKDPAFAEATGRQGRVHGTSTVDGSTFQRVATDGRLSAQLSPEKVKVNREVVSAIGAFTPKPPPPPPPHGP